MPGWVPEQKKAWNSLRRQSLKFHGGWMETGGVKAGKRSMGRRRATRLGCTGSRWSRTGTRSGLWCDGTARCCARTAGTTGCSGARRSPESRLQAVSAGGREGREEISQRDKRYVIMKRGKTSVIKGAERKKRVETRRYKGEETRGDSEGREGAGKSDFIVITSINLALEREKKKVWQTVKSPLYVGSLVAA